MDLHMIIAIVIAKVAIIAATIIAINDNIANTVGSILNPTS